MEKGKEGNCRGVRKSEDRRLLLRITNFVDYWESLAVCVYN